MNERVTRQPYDHALHLVNVVGEGIDKIAETPGGRPRDLDGPTATAVLVAASNTAIAVALLAIADALRAAHE